MSAFNEDSRVKIPAMLHLTRLGYHDLSLKPAVWHRRNNIFTGIFESAITRIKPGVERGDVQRLLDDIHLDLQNEDLGKYLNPPAHRDCSLPEAAAGQWEGLFRHPSFARSGRRYGDQDWQKPLDLVRARLLTAGLSSITTQTLH